MVGGRQAAWQGCAYGDAHSVCYANIYADCNDHGHGHSHDYPNADTDAHTYNHTNAYADCDTDKHGHIY